MSARTGALRRRRKPSLATRLRIGWVFMVLIVGALAYLIYLFVTLPAFRAHTVEVNIDGLAVTKREVLAAADIDPSANMWLMDTAKIVRRIEAIPYVAVAGVQRIPPSRMAITVSEREPAACVRAGARVVTVDATRRILQDGCGRASVVEIDVADTALGAPGSDAATPHLAQLLVDARILRDANVDVRTLREDRFGQLLATDRSAIKYLFGDDGDLARKAKLIGPVLAATRPGRSIRVIDIRSPSTPTVEFR